MKYLIVLIIGITIGYVMVPAKNLLPPEKTNDFQKLLDKEVKNFAQETDAHAKLKAAEELYGKMMVLFLSHLSLKSTHTFVPATPVAAEAESVELAQVSETENLPVVSEKNIDKSIEAKPETSPLAEKQTDQQRYNEYQSAHYLESFKSKQRRLLGHFVGTLRRSQSEERYDIVRMEFNLIQEGKNLSGGTLVTLTDHDGKELSRSAGDGGNRALKAHPKEVDTYYVDVSPTSFFVINFKKFPHITGHYFERGKLIGEVELKKISGDM